MDDPYGVYGRLHPLVVHLPIGMIVTLALLEVGTLFMHVDFGRRALTLLSGVTALVAVLAAATGWVLAGSDEYGGDILERHRKLGVAVAALTFLFAALHTASVDGKRLGILRAYRALLFVTLLLLIPAGHLGATLTHGEDYLLGTQYTPDMGTAPAGPGGSESAASGAAASTFASEIAPILAARCTGCHGETKRKAKLALHDAASIQAGSAFGPVIVPGKVDESELIRRVRLPLADEEHMPPEGKTQLTEDQIQRLEAWVSVGAPFEGTVELGLPPPEPIPDEPESTGALDPPAPMQGALAALEEARVHVERVDPAGGGLWVDLGAAAARTEDAVAAELLAPVSEHVEDLSLARSRVGPATLALAATMPRLTRLDLRATPVDDEALASLATHPALEELVLVKTRLTDESVDTLLSLPALRRVFLWNSGVSAEGLARLEQARPELAVDDGATPDSAAVEIEPELAFASDRPPGATRPLRTPRPRSTRSVRSPAVPSIRATASSTRGA